MNTDSVQAAIALVPAWVTALVLIAVALMAGLIAHAAIRALARRAVGARRPFLHSLLDRTTRPARLALVLLALAAALSWAPLQGNIAQLLARLLLVGFIVLLGWIALLAANIATSVYLARFSLDSEDNLLARKHFTQVRILERALDTLVVIITAAVALSTFDSVRQFGVSLFASAGLAGLVAGLAARPVLANLMAGVQIAITQPIRIGDAVVIEGEAGHIDEITSTYVVVRIWDWRRLIVPLSYFIEKPFQNWTHQTSSIIGTVLLYTDYCVPVAKVRDKLEQLVKASPLWDGQVVNLQVTDWKEDALELRALMSARSAASAWDLRCDVREKLVAFLNEQYPQALPRRRQVSVGGTAAAHRQAGVAQEP